ncbi:hypothetical protein A0J57_04075 [Sphingobium sp. 22B]|uniref:acetyl-CoA hydrolase/transferase family protein n=1 Tax=unclassified Sphingobium TaxID=2611147 RepID=UPI0007865B9A|nr:MULTISPECIES: acetyl-CoA hydrolase/transferase C-terminal domain-containing protein [unclassified Sphingobium]KXU33826.1 hypothetical protein AXW74_00625 [Sphingobium sp. AM]KYC33770.1 hypothetical protein A0J57_04075 [Sphingobium sp. 22B]OAP33508.1 hypothetical protein A8O16_03295 [Sphingobium sp. 20006FA]
MFKPQDRIFLPGSCGAPQDIVDAVLSAPDARITTSFVPGINPLRSEDIPAGCVVSGLFMQPGLADAQRDGRYRHLPFSYAATIKWLRDQPGFDCCVIQVTPPDSDGNCSLGPAAEFTPDVLRRAGRIVAVVNPHVPRIANAPVVPVSRFAHIVHSTAPLPGYDVGEVDAATRRIASLAAAFIADGDVLQVGLGKVPHALMQALCDRRNLRLHSGMLSDGVMALAEAGALDPDWAHVTTVVLGSRHLYQWAAERKDIHVRGVEHSHDPMRLAALERFIAVNSALEVDLFGQCNLELAAGRAVSGAGGAPDFARAARLGRGGMSIVALPATFGGGKGSRIRPLLGDGGLASLSRVDVDAVVTEQGAADLRGLSVHERAAALIAIAAPDAREGLARAWREMAAKL